jgi:hypothetical protein
MIDPDAIMAIVGWSPAEAVKTKVQPVTDIRAKYVPAAIDLVSFNCPHAHCGALAKQSWYTLHAEPMKKDGTPLIIDEQKVKDTNLDHIEAPEERKKLSWWLEQMARGRPFLEPHRDTIDYNLANVSLSLCYSCNDVAIWIYDRLVWPQRGEAPRRCPSLC